MAVGDRLLGSVEPPAGGCLDFKGSLAAFLEQLQCVPLPALDTTCWILPLSDGSSKLFIFEETLGPENFACDCCRIVGWQTHPVSTKNWHFIVPAEEGQYSLSDHTSLCAIANARSRGLEGSARIALPAPDPDAPHHYQSASFFESKMHRLHGTVHSNGYGHLARLNGLEGGSKQATGRQLMQLWDDLCEVLRVREVSTEDVSNKAGMELRVLHTAARRATWYGQWHYGFGRGGFNMTPQQWQKAIDYVNSAAVDDVLSDFDGIDATVMDILQRYRDMAAAASGSRESLGQLLSRMLGLLSHPEPILPVFELAAAAERERQRMVAEQRMLMAAYHEQQRQLAAQQAQHPLCLDNGPTAAYFGVSLQQQELQRQQQELFALTCQPVAAAAMPQEAAAAAAAPPEQQQQQQQHPEAAAPAAAAATAPTNGVLAGAAPEQQQQQQQQQPMAGVSAEAVQEVAQEAQPMETEGSRPSSGAVDPDGEAAAPSGEPEMVAAAVTEAAAAEEADEELALTRATAQAAIAAAVQAVDGHLPGVPAPAAHADVAAPEATAAATAEQQQHRPGVEQPAAGIAAAQHEGVPGGEAPYVPPPLAPMPLFMSPPPPPPLPASAAAAAAEEVDQWLAPYSSSESDGKDGGASTDAAGTSGGASGVAVAAEGGNGGARACVQDAMGPVEGTLHCLRAARSGEPPLADAEEPALAAAKEAVAAAGGGGVLRLRGGGGSRKRPASAGGGSDGGDAGKRQKSGAAGTSSSGGAGAEPEGERLGEEVVGRSLMVYWKEQKTYYTGTVSKYNPNTGKHTIIYRDGDKEVLELHKERFKWSERERVHEPLAAPPAGPAPKADKPKGARAGKAAGGSKVDKADKAAGGSKADKAAGGSKADKADKAEKTAAAADCVAPPPAKRAKQQEQQEKAKGKERKQAEEEGTEKDKVAAPAVKRAVGGKKAAAAAQAEEPVPVKEEAVEKQPAKKPRGKAAEKAAAEEGKASGSHKPPPKPPAARQQKQQQQPPATVPASVAAAAAATAAVGEAGEGDQLSDGRQRRSRSDPMPEEHPHRQQPRRGAPGEAHSSPSPAPAPPAAAAPQQQQQPVAQAHVQLPALEADAAVDERRAVAASAAAAKAAAVAAKVFAGWTHPHIPPPRKPLGGASLKAYIKRHEGLAQQELAQAQRQGTPPAAGAAPAAGAPAAAALSAPAAESPASAAEHLMDEDAAAAAALAAAAVAGAIASNTPPDAQAAGAAAAAAARAVRLEAAAVVAGAAAGAAAAAAPAEAAHGADQAGPSAPARTALLPASLSSTLTTEQLALAAARHPSYHTKDETNAELAAGKLVLGCGSCRYATGGCRRCRPRLVAALERLEGGEARLDVLGGCQRCNDTKHGCPVCWRMVVLSSDPPTAARLLAEAEEAAAAAAAAAGAGGDVPSEKMVGSRGKRKQQEAEQAPASEQLGGAAEQLPEHKGEPAEAARPKKQQQARQRKQAQQQQQQLGAAEEAAAAAEAAVVAPPAEPAASPEPPSPRPQSKKQQQQQAQQAHRAQQDDAAAGAATAAAAGEGATPMLEDAATPVSPPLGVAPYSAGRKVKASDGKHLVDENVKADVQAARSRGDIVLGCGRCRYRVATGCVDCRIKALLQMRQEGLRDGLDAIGCPSCESAEQGCRHCWPAAIEVAMRQRRERPIDERPTPAAVSAQQQQEQQEREKAVAREAKTAGKKDKAGKASKSAKATASPVVPKAGKMDPETVAAAAATMSPATLAAALAAGAGSSSSRRNKALLAVQRSAVLDAHAKGMYALGCGRCRYSMTGGCNNCRSKSAEVLRKAHPAWAARLGCEHCEGGEDGCPHCWKDMLVAMGPSMAVLRPAPDQVEAAINYLPPEADMEALAEAGAGAAAAAQQYKDGSRRAKESGRAKPSRPSQQSQQRRADAAVVLPVEGEAVRFGSRIQNARIKVWWSEDSQFYSGRITSYKQGLHRVLYDDQHAEKIDLVQNRIQLQFVEGGAWMEYNAGMASNDAAHQAALGLFTGAPTAGAVPAQQLPAQPLEQPLGVPVKSLLQKRVRVLCSDLTPPVWKEGVVVGYNHGKFAVNFDDSAKGRYFLQYEQWEPLDLELLQQRQQAQRAAQLGAAAAALPGSPTEKGVGAGAGALPGSLPPRQRAQRASAVLPPGGYSTFFDEEAGWGEHEWDGTGRMQAPPAVPGAATGPPPPLETAPRAFEELPEPLQLPSDGERARKVQYKFGLQKYVGQRVRVWSEEQQEWREGVVTSFVQGRHKVHFYDGSRDALNMQTDCFQLLPQPGSPAEPSVLLPPAIPAAQPPAAAAPPPAGVAGSARRSEPAPPKVMRPPLGAPVLEAEALPAARERLQETFVLPACSQPFSLDKITRVLRLTLAKLKEYPGQWVPKSYVRQYLHAAGIRDNSLMDYCGRSLDSTTLDGWAVFRNRSTQHNCLYYLAEKVGDDGVLTEVMEPPRSESTKRAPRKASDLSLGLGDGGGAGGMANGGAPHVPTYYAAPPAQPQRPQRRFAGYNVRRGGGALSPRTGMASSGAPRRQQPWQMLLPAGVPPAPLTAEQCRHQVMADLVYLFNNTLRQYKPAKFLEAQLAARAAALACGGTSDQPPPRTLRLDRLLQEVQVLRDCKHFIKAGSGERFGDLPTPPGMLRLLCHLAMPEVMPDDESGESEPSWAAPVQPPPEVLLLPDHATVGQLLEAATSAFRASYRMCASWTAEAVVGGLTIAVPPAPPGGLPAPVDVASAGLPAGMPDGAEPMQVDEQPAEPAAADVPAVMAGHDMPAAVEGMEVDGEDSGSAPAAAGAPAQAAGEAAADSEAQLAAVLAATAVAAVVRAHDGPAAAGGEAAAAVGQATAELAAVQLAAVASQQAQQQQQQQVLQQPQLVGEELAQRQRLMQERAALLATRLADVLLPAPQQAVASADATAAAGDASGAAAQGQQAPALLPSVVVEGPGLDWAVRWRHAGGLEDWAVRCRCGVHDDDGERMIMCDTCQIWQHTRCYNIHDDQPVPEHTFTCDTCAAAAHQHGEDAQHAQHA